MAAVTSATEAGPVGLRRPFLRLWRAGAGRLNEQGNRLNDQQGGLSGLYSSMGPTGAALNIHDFCTHDGPGICTTVFLKGCSLRCKWCSNPESIHPKPELAYNPSKCIGKKECGLCLKAPWPEGAMYVVDGADDKVHVNWDLVGDCTEEMVPLCAPMELHMFGQTMTVAQVLAEEQDSSFYRESGGGITLSGGECLLQPEFSAALLAEARLFKNVIDHELVTVSPVRRKQAWIPRQGL